MTLLWHCGFIVFEVILNSHRKNKKVFFSYGMVSLYYSLTVSRSSI